MLLLRANQQQFTLCKDSVIKEELLPCPVNCNMLRDVLLLLLFFFFHFPLVLCLILQDRFYFNNVQF